MKLDDIKYIGLKFRSAIENMPLSQFPESPFFARFPRGCCGDTSHLFAKYLMSFGYAPLYVCGFKGQQTHAWIEINDAIIDLTADQFDDVDEKVIVTTDRSWHCKFKRQKRYLSNFDTFDSHSALRYQTIYNNILSYINNEQ